jgi:hypothetical protein
LAENLAVKMEATCSPEMLGIFSVTLYKYREYFYSVGRVHGSALHAGRCTAYCELLMNFADESACLIVDNVWNEGK